MRTTIRIDEELLKEAKSVAEATGQTLSEVVEDALRESLARRHGRTSHPAVTLPTFKGSGLSPGVNLDNWAALLDLLSSSHAAS